MSDNEDAFSRALTRIWDLCDTPTNPAEQNALTDKIARIAKNTLEGRKIPFNMVSHELGANDAPRFSIPPIPAMTELDEEWIAWAAGTANIRPEVARGLLAGLYTMRAKRLAVGIASIQRDISHGENAIAGLLSNMLDPQDLVAKDLAMWQELLPQLQELAR